VLDPTILGPIGLIAEASLLKENGVEKIFLLNEPDLGDLGDLHTVLYISRPSIDLMKLVAKQIHAQAKKDISFFCFFVPRRTLLVERILEELGCLGDIRKMGEFNLDLIPFDDDLLSMELPFAFRECVLV
jgi:vacuolar protein sorting-associated protein 33A